MKSSKPKPIEEIRFSRSRKSKMSGLFLSVLISLSSILLMLFGIQTQNNLVIIVFAGFLVFGIYRFIKNLRNSITVLVNQHGIFSNVNGMGWIAWEFIDHFEVKNGFNTNFLAVYINDQERFINSKNTLTQKLMKSNLVKFGTPVILPQQEFNEPFEVVLSMIEKYNYLRKNEHPI